MTQTIQIIYEGKTYELPIIEGTFGEKAVDISQLRATTGLITYDPVFVRTGSCQSQITYLDGEKGILLYRGIPIEQLAEKSTFIETAYLLIYGHLPTPAEFETFTYHVKHHSMVHESIKNFYNGFPNNSHPMAVFSAVVGALATFYQDQMNQPDDREIEVGSNRVLAEQRLAAANSATGPAELSAQAKFAQDVYNQVIEGGGSIDEANFIAGQAHKFVGGAGRGVSEATVVPLLSPTNNPA